ncbi:MAG: hypothetical protein R3B57_11495 [Phycisphaerales bacterium]
MFAKLVALILGFGACGGGLLAMRQSRLQAAHELAEARLRIERHEMRISELRAQIAERITPEQVRVMLGGEELDRMSPGWTRRVDLVSPELIGETHEAVQPALPASWGARP